MKQTLRNLIIMLLFVTIGLFIYKAVQTVGQTKELVKLTLGK